MLTGWAETLTENMLAAHKYNDKSLIPNTDTEKPGLMVHGISWYLGFQASQSAKSMSPSQMRDSVQETKWTVLKNS